MVVKSKFSIDEEVWFISHNKVQKSKITAVDISVNGDGQKSIKYTLMFDSEINEEKLYPTKEELLKSL